jgi:hypothetical protein
MKNVVVNFRRRVAHTSRSTMLPVPLDKGEGVAKAQNSCAVFFTALLLRVMENRSSETLTVNQLSADSFRQPSIRPEPRSSG